MFISYALTYGIDQIGVFVRAGGEHAADGVESQVARQAGMNNCLELKQVAAALEYRVENINVESDTISFYVGREIAPGGYIWVFPKSQNSANIGLAISVDDRDGVVAADYLDGFMADHFPSGCIREKFCGMLPSYRGKEMFHIGNILVAGDAARAVDSLSGAGIVNAVYSGRYAGQAAVEFLSGRVGNINNIERLYPGKFLDERGDDLNNYLKLRRVYTHVNDGEFTEIIRELRRYFKTHNVYNIHAAGLLLHLIKTKPRLLRLVRYLI